MARVQVLAVGPWQDREFRAAKAEVEEAAGWQTVADIVQAGEYLKAGETLPELILLAQPLPGRYYQKQIDQLQFLAPLARIVVVSGSWCEGEMRTGTPMVGVLRLYWYEFAPWWKSARNRVAAGLCPPWSLPLDHPQAGRCLPPSKANRPSLGGPVAISSGDFTVYESLAAALSTDSIDSFWVQPAGKVVLDQKVAAGIWDGSQLDAGELQRLAAFCRQVGLHGAKVVALLDFPRVEHMAQAQDAGASAVFGKPYVVEELLVALCGHRGRKQPSSR